MKRTPTGFNFFLVSFIMAYKHVDSMEANAHFADSCKSILCLLSQGKQHKCSSSASRLLWQSSSGSRQGTRFSTATSEAENTYKRLPLGDSSQEPTCKQSPPALCVRRPYLFLLVDAGMLSILMQPTGIASQEGRVKLPGSELAICATGTLQSALLYLMDTQKEREY